MQLYRAAAGVRYSEVKHRLTANWVIDLSNRDNQKILSHYDQ